MTGTRETRDWCDRHLRRFVFKKGRRLGNVFKEEVERYRDRAKRTPYFVYKVKEYTPEQPVTGGGDLIKRRNELKTHRDRKVVT